MIEHASHTNFKVAVIEASFERPVLVDFWATWCGPCQSLAPILETLATGLAGKLDVVKVDTDAESTLAAEYGVRSLPTMLLFRNGEVVDQIIGAQPQSALESFVEPWLAKTSDAAVGSAHTALADGEPQLAVEALEAALEIEPTDYRIHALLATAYLDLSQIESAESLLAGLPANVVIEDQFDTIKSRIRMARSALDGSGETDEISSAYSAAVEAAARQDYDLAVSGLLGMLPAHRDWRDGAIRTALLDVFNVLGSDPRVRKWRSQMARSLN